MSNEPRDMNRDPLSGAPGAHPVGVGVGGAGGAMAGAAVGALLGPIGMLVGGAVGAIAGGAAGKGVAERIDPTGETEYWRNEHAHRPYVDRQYDYDKDYAPAYAYGDQVRNRHAGRSWDQALEAEVRQGWDSARSDSRLDWDKARDAVRDAYDRSDRTYRAYEATDQYYLDKHRSTDYYNDSYQFDSDYRPAYRYGTYARSAHAGRSWDPTLEADLERGWDKARGSSRMDWAQARAAVRDAWDRVETVLPGNSHHSQR